VAGAFAAIGMSTLMRGAVMREAAGPPGVATP
jgi:hypothetical protein